MGAKVTEVAFSGNGKSRGVFKCQTFNLFDAEECQAYADFRTRANDPSNGITLELLQQVTKKSTKTEVEGEFKTTDVTEDIVMIVQWWEKAPRMDKGESDGEVTEARKSWSREKPAGDDPG